MTTALEPQAAGLPEPVTRRGINEWQWRTLKNSLFPGAKSESILLAIDYCRARNLDPLKKPCHIVPMEVKVGDKYEWRDVILPGIYELRTTAQRTGEYLGHAKAEYGPSKKWWGVEAPEYCDFTVYRWNAAAKMRAEFPVRVFFAEVVGTKFNKDRTVSVNARWTKAPIQMLTKCSEASALREAFPDELGGQMTEEEMADQRAIDVDPIPPARPELPKPDKFDDWLHDMTAVIDEGPQMLAEAWKNTPQAVREYLLATQPETWEQWKAKAAGKPANPDDEPGRIVG